MSDWSPSTYLAFEDERTRPARELLARVSVSAPRSVVDVGCGPGNSTELLTARWPSARVTGLDSSPAMLEAARQRVPEASFVQADAQHWVPEPGTDVVFANATYQWIPDHLAVLPRVLEALAPGAELAVQMPDNLAEPTHLLMHTAARSFPALATAGREPLPPAAAYYDALAPHAARIDVWHVIYQHVMDDADAIVTWVKATGLRTFLDPLSPADQTKFLAEYTDMIDAAYAQRANGKRLLRFPRLFLVATRG